MENRELFIIPVTIIAALIIFFAVRASYFEKIEVSSEDWSKNFNYDSDIPYGASTFYSLIKEKYGEDNIIRNHIDTSLNEIEGGDHLYIMFSEKAYLSYARQRTLREFIKKGNQALIISKSRYNQLTPDLSSNQMDGIMPGQFQIGTPHDSIFKFKFTKYQDSLSYMHYAKSITQASPFFPNTYQLPNDSIYTDLASESDSTSIFFKATLDTGEVFFHVFPELFSNVAAKQDFYLPHFNATLSHVSGETIIIDHPRFNKSRDKRLDQSPIQYILDNKSLRWAYYAFLLTTLGFLFFRGKRKQRIIPIPEKNENTSIKYVDTLSDLFEQQNQNLKLVPHMETIFMQRVKQKYYLLPDNEKFVNLLSKKSRIPENQITAILNYFKTGREDHNFNDDQLIMLHQRLEDFYNNAE